MDFKNFTFLLFFFLTVLATGQTPIPSSGDLNWDTNILPLNDDFLSPTLNTNNWASVSPSMHWGLENFESNNIILDPNGNNGSGLLKLKMYKVLDPTQSTGYKYYSGGIQTGQYANQPNAKGWNYPFGFYEIRCQLPSGKGLWPAFWIQNSYLKSPYKDACNTTNGDLVSGHYEEIDILENPDMGGGGGSISNPFHPEWNTDQYRGYNWFFTYPQIPCKQFCKAAPSVHGYPTEILLPGISTSAAFHTYALEWLHNTDDKGLLVFYFDGIPQTEAVFKDYVPDENHMQVLVTHQVNYEADIADTQSPPRWGPTPNEAYFSIDYVRVYQLNQNYSSTIVTFNNQTDLNNFFFALRKEIIFNSTITLPNNSKKVFRATNGITLNSELTIPLGAEFTAIVHDCQPDRTPENMPGIPELPSGYVPTYTNCH